MNTGRDVRNVLLRKNLLDKDADVKTMMDILHDVKRTDLAKKLEKCLVIGQCFANHDNGKFFCNTAWYLTQ